MADYGVRITLAAASPVPTYTAGPWVSGVASLSSSSAVAGWSSGILIDCGSPGEQVDIAGGGNYASVSDVDVVLFAGWVPAFEAAGVSMFGATVEVGTISGSTLTVRWSGVVSDLGWRGTEYRITAESVITLRHREIPARILSGDEFSGLPADAEGRVVPALYGAVERLAPPSLLSDRDYLMGQYVYPSGALYQIERSTTFVATGTGVPAVTASVLPIVTDINTSAGPITRPVDYDDTPWWNSTNVYMEIFEGTGSGQTRAVQTIPALYSTTTTISGNELWYLTITLASPLETLPDAFSGIRFYTQAVGAVLVVGDEATTESVTVDLDGESYPIGFAPGSVGGFATADVSDEFRSGEDYAAIEYQRPSNVFGIADLSDGVTEFGSFRLMAPYYYQGASRWTGDVICRGSLNTMDLPDSALSRSVTVYFVASVVAPSDALREYSVQCIATRWDGSEDIIATKQDVPWGNGLDTVNGYSPAILPDGTVGAFAQFAKELTFPVPLRNYERIRYGVAWGEDPTTEPTLGPSLGYCTLTQGLDHFFADVGSAGWSGATDIVGKAVAPSVPTVANPLSPFERERFQAHSAGFRGTIPDDRRSVVSAIFVSGTIWRINLDAAIATPTGDYLITSYDPAWLVTVTEREVGLLISYGAIPQDSQFIASTSSGRTFGPHWTALPAGQSNGDPITDAAHVAQDIFLRDLAIPQADIGASYLAMPAYTARVALVEQDDSATILSRMCREFCWVGGHDNAGRETLADWLTRLYTATADFAVVNAEIVEDSLVGVDATSLDDIVTLPRVAWDWTQADGFRGAGTVTDCSADPSTITPANYLRTVSGFGDYSTALSTYEVLHEAWRRNGIRRSESIEYKYGGNPTDLMLPARLEWSASRKDLLQFKLNESHAASAAYLGQRISITHKRYTGGGTVYGTLVARYWLPADGQIQLTVMLDPVAFAVDNLFVDTIDPTATIEQYTDQFDGTSEQYTDTLGA